MLIEPTAARTRLNANTIWAGDGGDSPYAGFYKDLARWHAESYAGPPHNIAGLAVSADEVARMITRAVTSGRPRARYPVGVLARGLFRLRRWLPRPRSTPSSAASSPSLIPKTTMTRPVRTEHA